MSDTKETERALRGALVGNATFSAVTGSVLLAAGGQVAELIGLEHDWVLRLVGAGLLPFAAAVAVCAQPQNIGPRGAYAISAADFAWVAASVLLVAAGPGLLNATGHFLVAAVSVVVAGFGAFQMRAAGRLAAASS